MATTTQCYERWLNYNKRGIGKPTGTVSSHRYNENVYYYSDVPLQRIFQRKGLRPVVVMAQGLMPKKMREGFDEIYVDDIAVFSKYAGDMLDDDAAHDRQRYMMLCRIQELVDVLVPAKTDEECARPQTLPSCQKAMNRYYDSYRDYSALFSLGWPELPQSYMERMTETIYRKKDRWSDPKAIIKRERAAAKREAIKALGLT